MFSEVFSTLPVRQLAAWSLSASAARVDAVLRRGRAETLEDFAALLSPAAGERLEELCTLSQAVTRRHFGKTIRLFAPIYLSNECVNICKYCGFSRHLKIPRVTIPVSQFESEVQKLAGQGFRSLLIVAGEHPKYVSNGYVEECVRVGLRHIPGIHLELGPMETEGYLPLVKAGCEGLVVYQETYNEATYRELHTAGPKKHYGWRMDTAERGYAAGFRRLGIGALFGLHDWRFEAVALAAHGLHLAKHCWKSQLTLALPRMRPAAGDFLVKAENCIPDRAFVQALCAYRLLLPFAGFVLSTREAPRFRDGLVTLGVTHMSAGSSTEPGGYSSFDESSWTPTADQPAEQFHIADERSPAAVADMIRRRGYEPVWKDSDQSLVTESFRELAASV